MGFECFMAILGGIFGIIIFLFLAGFMKLACSYEDGETKLLGMTFFLFLIALMSFLEYKIIFYLWLLH